MFFFAVSGSYVFFLAYFYKKWPISFLGPFGGSECVAGGDQKCWFSVILPFSGLQDPGYSQVLFFLARSDTINGQKVKRGVKTTSDRFSGCEGGWTGQKSPKITKNEQNPAKTLFFTALINFLLNKFRWPMNYTVWQWFWWTFSQCWWLIESKRSEKRAKYSDFS